jgi:hypothetical protein
MMPVLLYADGCLVKVLRIERRLSGQYHRPSTKKHDIESGEIHMAEDFSPRGMILQSYWFFGRARKIKRFSDRRMLPVI